MFLKNKIVIITKKVLFFRERFFSVTLFYDIKIHFLKGIGGHFAIMSPLTLLKTP
ncbi:hypothetical protein HMPREF1430_00150 [Helicobacter pylori GAM96Ai]|nr:hypothetical protein HMPREF1430_00150 [Helicobacter pylori GAM96Ai]